ncbi:MULTISPECIES: hypothetical protein [unclassified Mesorhizobium]|nr:MULTISPECIES: hypothetical protein [unclassified Mesorhizobium]
MEIAFIDPAPAMAARSAAWQSRLPGELRSLPERPAWRQAAKIANQSV